MHSRRHPNLWFLVLSAILALPLPAWSQQCEVDRPTPEQLTDRRPAALALEAHFSPHGGCTETVVREIESAKTRILVQAYGFTSPPIAAALVKAHKRGVEVRTLLDRSQRKAVRSEAETLQAAGIPVLFDGAHPIAHNKVMIIDGRTVLTGSFNFTRQAELNGENLLVIHDRELAAKYAENWARHAEHSER